MKLNQKIAVLLAFVLAAVLSLSGCGGGTASGTVPTATITSAAGTGGTVVFTIAFNESVGTTFNAGEVTVTGGTAASSVTSIGSNSYTLVVTPTSGATSVVATLPINKVTDINGNSNTVEAKNTYTVPATTANITIVGTNTTPVAANLNPNWGQATAETTATGNVMNMTSFNYQGIDLTANPVNATGMQYLHLDFTASSMTTLGVALVTNVGITGKTQAETAYAITSISSSGNSVDIPLTSYSGGTPVADLTSIGQIKLTNGADGQAGGPSSGGTLSITNMYFSASAKSGSTNGSTTPAAANITIVGANTTPVANINYNPGWGQATVETMGAGNVMNLTSFNYQGIDLTANPVNATGMQYLHLDFTASSMTTLGVALVTNVGITGKTQAETAYAITSISSSGNSVDIPLTSYSGGTPVADLTSIGQIKLTNGADGQAGGPSSGGTLSITNMYFSASAKSGSTNGTSGSGGGTTPVNSGGTTGTLNFMTGFKTATTVEGGAYGGTSGSSLDGWNCPGNSATATTSCGSGGSFTDGSSPAASAAVSSFYAYYQFKGTAPTGEYAGINVFAPGVTAISGTADTAGMVLNGQTTVSFNLGMNAEFFSNSNHNVAVLMNLGKHYAAGGGCNLQLQTVFTPTSAASTSYTLPLSSFAVAQDCATGTPPTGYAAALTASPAVSQIAFQAASGASAFHPNLSGSLTSGANTTVANGTYIPTTLSLTGGISFQ